MEDLTCHQRRELSVLELIKNPYLWRVPLVKELRMEPVLRLNVSSWEKAPRMGWAQPSPTDWEPPSVVESRKESGLDEGWAKVRAKDEDLDLVRDEDLDLGMDEDSGWVKDGPTDLDSGEALESELDEGPA
jgi:hypothetical protein